MDKFNLREYLSNNPLLKENIDYSSVKDEMKRMYDIDVDLDTIEDFITTYNDGEGMDVFDTTEREDFYLYLKEPDQEDWEDPEMDDDYYDMVSDIGENISMEDSPEKIDYYVEEVLKLVTPYDKDGVTGVLDFLLNNPEEMPSDWDVDFVIDYGKEIQDKAYALEGGYSVPPHANHKGQAEFWDEMNSDLYPGTMGDEMSAPR